MSSQARPKGLGPINDKQVGRNEEPHKRHTQQLHSLEQTHLPTGSNQMKKEQGPYATKKKLQ